MYMGIRHAYSFAYPQHQTCFRLVLIDIKRRCIHSYTRPELRIFGNRSNLPELPKNCL